ncbi:MULTISPECIES: hypothetical protein [unclassified Mycoplasma]|uniref:hypothetical protein n=1 Tax=unclassified Mycoplasma TaxID=2683645 RepID=UPI002B1D5BB0|nr:MULTISPECIES: hypothetical protein [unclassified Mycoplasma]MEA4205924.1 hypothetical protein [Mycoplasma sp. 1199]MEA4333917.1 hypothetical protein [Mycoplasma sp. 1232]
MDTLQIKQMFIDSISKVPGVRFLHEPTLDINCEPDTIVRLNPEEYFENIEVLLTENSRVEIKAAITVFDGTPIKFIISQIYKIMEMKLKSKKFKFNKLIIIVKGVTNE